MASKANKIRRSRETRARLKAANRRRLEAIRAGVLVLKPRHGKAVRQSPRVSVAAVLAKWRAKVAGLLRPKKG